MALAFHSPYSNDYTCIICENPLSVMSDLASTIPLAFSIIVTVALGLCFDAVLTGMCSGINVIGHANSRKRNTGDRPQEIGYCKLDVTLGQNSEEKIPDGIEALRSRRSGITKH